MKLDFKILLLLLALLSAACNESTIQEAFHPGISVTEEETASYLSTSSMQSGLINRVDQSSISFKLTFSDAVTVSGSPKLKLKIGTRTRLANYASGSGSSELTFTYTIQNNDLDLDGVEVLFPLDFGSGSIASGSNGNSVSPSSATQTYPNLKIIFPNLLLWLDFSNPESMYVASTCTGSSPTADDLVGCVLDQSGNGLNAVMDTTSFKPQYKEGIISGNSVVTFDGIDDYLRIPHNSSLMNGISQMSAFIVFQPSSLGYPYGLISKRPTSNSASSFAVFIYTSSKVFFDLPAQANRNNTVNPVATHTPYYFSLLYDGTQSVSLRGEAYINGLFDTNGSALTTLTNTTDPITIGTLNEGYTDFFPGHIGEIILFKRALDKSSGGELEVLHQYISSRWGI